MAFSFFSGLLTNGIWSFQVDRIPIFTGWPTAAMFNRLRHQQLLPMEPAEAELALKRPQLAKYLTGHPYRIEFLARAETRMTWSRPPWWWGPSIAKMSTRPSRAWPPTQTWLRPPEPLLFCKWTVSSLWWTRHNAVRPQLHYTAHTTSKQLPLLSKQVNHQFCDHPYVPLIWYAPMQIDPVSVKHGKNQVWLFTIQKKRMNEQFS